MIAKESIALLTTVANFDLYQKTASLFPSNITLYVIDGTNGMHGIDSILYMMKKLKNKSIDWLIMADEDVVFTNTDAVFELISFMQEKNYTVAGIRDGGLIAHRNFNPYAINTFFSVLNFKVIKSLWNKNEMLKNQYIIPKEFNDNLDNLPFIYDVNSLYEPYYCFYFWLRRMGKEFLFLESQMEPDAIANTIYFNNKQIAVHTWYARAYGKNEKHTQRIDYYLQKFKVVGTAKVHYTMYKKYTFALVKKVEKLLRKIHTKLRPKA